MDETPRSTSRASAARVERALREAESGLTMGDLVASTGLHENGLRRVLGRMIAEGSAHATPDRRPVRGRPRLRYRHAGAPDEAFREFLPLLLELTDREPPSDAAAYAVGRAYGASSPTGARDAREAVMRSLATRGFAPRDEGADETGTTTISLRRCPFADAVTGSSRGARICSLHHGLLAGVAEANGGRLGSFTVHDPTLAACVVSLR